MILGSVELRLLAGGAAMLIGPAVALVDVMVRHVERSRGRAGIGLVAAAVISALGSAAFLYTVWASGAGLGTSEGSSGGIAGSGLRAGLVTSLAPGLLLVAVAVFAVRRGRVVLVRWLAAAPFLVVLGLFGVFYGLPMLYDLVDPPDPSVLCRRAEGC